MVQMKHAKALRAKTAPINRRKVLRKGNPVRKPRVQLKCWPGAHREESEQLESSPCEFTAQRTKTILQILSAATNCSVTHTWNPQCLLRK